MSTDTRGHSPRHLWYFLTIGLIGATAVVAIATVPRSLVVYPLALGAAAVAITDFTARRFSKSPLTPPLGRGELAYVVVFGAVFIGSVVLALMVAYGSAVWLGWALGAVVFVTAAAGACVPEEE